MITCRCINLLVSCLLLAAAAAVAAGPHKSPLELADQMLLASGLPADSFINETKKFIINFVSSPAQRPDESPAEPIETVVWLAQMSQMKASVCRTEVSDKLREYVADVQRGLRISSALGLYINQLAQDLTGYCTRDLKSLISKQEQMQLNQLMRRHFGRVSNIDNLSFGRLQAKQKALGQQWKLMARIHSLVAPRLSFNFVPYHISPADRELFFAFEIVDKLIRGSVNKD